MNTEGIKRVWGVWSDCYYTEPVLMMIIVIALFIGSKSKLTWRFRRQFILYSYASLILFLLSNFSYLLELKMVVRIKFLEIINLLFSIVELAILSSYLSHVIDNKFIKRVLKPILYSYAVIVFFIIGILNYLDVDNIKPVSTKLSVVEFSLLFALCIIYIRKLVMYKDIFFISQPSVLISGSVLAYCSIVIPFFVISENFLYQEFHDAYNAVFALHYISFSLIFICLIIIFRDKHYARYINQIED